jgi:hypothetical protein
VFDNTAANVVNPDPSQEVVWGPNATDEMFQATFETAAADQDLQARQPTALLLTAALASCWIVLRRRRINATAPA